MVHDWSCAPQVGPRSVGTTPPSSRGEGGELQSQAVTDASKSRPMMQSGELSLLCTEVLFWFPESSRSVRPERKGDKCLPRPQQTEVALWLGQDHPDRRHADS